MARSSQRSGEDERGLAAVPPSYMMTRLARAIGRRLTLSDLTLTGPQCVVLLALRHETGLSNAQLARRALVTPQAMHEVIQELERERLIEREPDADNRRILRARLTAAGSAMLTDWDVAIGRLEDDLFAGFDRTEIANFTADLKRCVANLGLSGPRRG